MIGMISPFQVLLFHEVWICLQHGNVLLNPLCQRLDRNYGISLFKNDMVWVIAFTLSAYWLREILSMSYSYSLVTPLTKQLIIASCAYHAFKIVNVNIDAWRKWSPKLGILRLLLDYWHFDTIANCIISFKRMFLQGFDTAVHGCIIMDMMELSSPIIPSVIPSIPFISIPGSISNTITDSLSNSINGISGISGISGAITDSIKDSITDSHFITDSGDILIPHARSIVLIAGLIWLFHAIIVQISRKSTATLMVEIYRKVAVFFGLIEEKAEVSILPTVKESTNRHMNIKMKEKSTIDLFLGPHIHASHKSSVDCQVCRMLSKPEPKNNNKNNKNSLNNGNTCCNNANDRRNNDNNMPSVVFLAHPVQLASAFSLWTDKNKGQKKGMKNEDYWRASWWMENSVIQLCVFFVSIVYYPMTVIWFGFSPVVIVDKSSAIFHSRSDGAASDNSSTTSATSVIRSVTSATSTTPTTAVISRSDKSVRSDNSATPGGVRSDASAPPPSVASVTKSEVWFAKSFGWQYASPSPFWRGYAKEMVVRSVLLAEREGVKVIGLGALNKAHWLNNGGEDVVFELERRRKEEGNEDRQEKRQELKMDINGMREIRLLFESEESRCEEGSLMGHSEEYSSDRYIEHGEHSSQYFSEHSNERSSNKIKVVHGNTLTAAVVCEHLKHDLKTHIKSEQRKYGLNESVREVRDARGVSTVRAMDVILVGATSKIGRAIALYMAGVEGVNIILVGASSRRMEGILSEGRLAAYNAVNAVNRNERSTDNLINSIEYSNEHNNRNNDNGNNNGNNTTNNNSTTNNSNTNSNSNNNNNNNYNHNNYQHKILHCSDVLTASELAPTAIWLLGKGGVGGLVDVIPMGARVLSFAVPCPIADMRATSLFSNNNDRKDSKNNNDSDDNQRGTGKHEVPVNDGSSSGRPVLTAGGRPLLRSDLRYIDAGVIVLPLSMQTQRQFTLMLPNRLVYTCHAAAIIHQLEGWNYHEVGEVILRNMEVTYSAAMRHGFSVDFGCDSDADNNFDVGHYDGDIGNSEGLSNEINNNYNTSDVVVIGCGPGGLAAAGSLLNSNNNNSSSNGIKNSNSGNKIVTCVLGSTNVSVSMFDQHTDIEGQWLSQYEGLSLTSRGQHSALPGLDIPIGLSDKGENGTTKGNLTALSYVRYLKLYARRFGLERHMKLGYSVVKVCRTRTTDTTHTTQTTEKSRARTTGTTSVNMDEESRENTDNNSNNNEGEGYEWEVHYKKIIPWNSNPKTTSTPSSTTSSTISPHTTTTTTTTPTHPDDRIYITYCHSIVVATGKAQVPIRDEGLNRALSGFLGPIINAKDVKDIQGLSSMGTVLLVGSGNSALDLCASLLKKRGSNMGNIGESIGMKLDAGSNVGNDVENNNYNANNGNYIANNNSSNNNNNNNDNNAVHMSMRSIPPCIPRQWGPLSVEEMSVYILQYLPPTIADIIVWIFYRILRTGSSTYASKIPGKKRSPDWYPFSSRRVPPIDKGGFAVGVATGRVVIHTCVERVVGKDVYFRGVDGVKGAKGGDTTTSSSSSSSSSSSHPVDVLSVDAIVLCTGYESDWSWLHLPSPLPHSLPLESLNHSDNTAPLTSQMQAHIQIHTPSQNKTDNNNDNYSRQKLLTTLAKTRSKDPLTSTTDGLFFIGYDPGNALVPLSAIRSQAKEIGMYATEFVRSKRSKI